MCRKPNQLLRLSRALPHLEPSRCHFFGFGAGLPRGRKFLPSRNAKADRYSLARVAAWRDDSRHLYLGSLRWLHVRNLACISHCATLRLEHFEPRLGNLLSGRRTPAGPGSGCPPFSDGRTEARRISRAAAITGDTLNRRYSWSKLLGRERDSCSLVRNHRLPPASAIPAPRLPAAAWIGRPAGDSRRGLSGGIGS